MEDPRYIEELRKLSDTEKDELVKKWIKDVKENAWLIDDELKRLSVSLLNEFKMFNKPVEPMLRKEPARKKYLSPIG